MPLFRRKNNPTISEIESYYEQQNRRSTSTGRAWLMAILAIILTIVVLALVIFGGRWVYNTLTDNDSTPAETTQQDVNSGSVSVDGFDTDRTEGVSSSENNSDNDTSSSDEGVVSDEAASTNETNVDRVAGSDTDESTEDDGTIAGSSSNIPNTGPGETALVIAVAAGLIGTVLSYRIKLQ